MTLGEIQRMRRVIREKRIQAEERKASTSSCHVDLGLWLGAVGVKGRRGRGHRDHVLELEAVGNRVPECGDHRQV